MAAAALTPRVRLMAICDGVRESRLEPGVFDLKNVRQGTVAETIPFQPRRLWLFLVLSSSRAGDFLGYVRIVYNRTERVVFSSYLNPRPTFDTDGDLCLGRASLRCTFPEPGQYSVQLWFFQEQGFDVLKGEVPFIATTAEEDQ